MSLIWLLKHCMSGLCNLQTNHSAKREIYYKHQVPYWQNKLSGWSKRTSLALSDSTVRLSLSQHKHRLLCSEHYIQDTQIGGHRDKWEWGVRRWEQNELFLSVSKVVIVLQVGESTVFQTQCWWKLTKWARTPARPKVHMSEPHWRLNPVWEKNCTKNPQYLETPVWGICRSPQAAQASYCSSLNSTCVRSLKMLKWPLCLVLFLPFSWVCSVLTDTTQSCNPLPFFSSNQQWQVHAALK